MKNLEQVRAASAFKTGSKISVKGKEGGVVIKKIPPMIQNHGILAALAYAYDESNKGWRDAFDAIAVHLSSAEIDLMPSNCNSTEKLIEHLTGPNSTSLSLKLVTAETLAWLSYARRFITEEERSGR